MNLARFATSDQVAHGAPISAFVFFTYRGDHHLWIIHKYAWWVYDGDSDGSQQHQVTLWRMKNLVEFQTGCKQQREKELEKVKQ